MEHDWPFPIPIQRSVLLETLLNAPTFNPWKNEKTHLQQPKTLKHPPSVQWVSNWIYQSTHAQVAVCAPVVFLVLKLTSNTLGVRTRGSGPSSFPFLNLTIISFYQWIVVTIEEVYCFFFFLKFWYVSPFWRCSAMVYCNQLEEFCSLIFILQCFLLLVCQFLHSNGCFEDLSV